jgi:hypothetical protein
MSSQQELQPIVDEEDVEEAPKESKGIDWDQTCAYLTFKVVRIRDRNLGMLYWFIVTLVILYIVIFALGMEGRHQYQEPGVGTVITRFKGKGFSNGKAWDAADLRYPEVEPYGAFITTKVIMMQQKIDNCVDFENPCPCRQGAECVDGFCKDQAWCPSLGEGNAENPEGAAIDVISGLENSIVEIHSGIAFPGIGNYFWVTGASAPELFPGNQMEFRNITLEALLAKTVPPTKLDDVIDTGALIGVSFFWNCDVLGDACEPNPVVKRLDNGKGFIQKRAFHSTKGGVDGRDAFMMYGVRILVDSSGLGRKISFVLIMIQVGSGLALLRTASMASDFMMLQLYSKVRADAYYKCKVEETEDYSDLQDRINLIAAQKHETHALLEKVVNQGGRGGAGAGVSLGLGPGGRGGIASTILRGRN